MKGIAHRHVSENDGYGEEVPLSRVGVFQELGEGSDNGPGVLAL